MKRPLMRLIGFIVLATLIAVPAEAQRTPATPQTPAEANEDAAAARFRLADSYLRTHQFDRAVTLLEDLYAEQPTSTPVIERLRQAYIGAQRFDEAVALVEERIQRQGRLPALLAELGSVYMHAGQSDRAEAVWEETLALGRSDVQTYRLLYGTMVQHRMWERARDLLLEGRRTLRQDDLFHVELAELYSRTNEYGEALDEWAAVIAADPSRLSFVQTRLSRMLDQDAAPEALRSALDRRIRRDPTTLVLRRLAAWLASESGDFVSGLDHVRAIDRLARESGESVFAYAEAAMQAGAFDPAHEALDLVLTQHPESPTGVLALLSFALLYEKMGEDANERAGGDPSRAPNYASAADRYNQFLDGHPNHPAVPVALQRLAELRRDVFHDYDRASELLSQIVSRYPNSEHAHDAQMALGELAILEDDLSRARSIFIQIENRLRTGTRAERARLALLEIDFYAGNLEMAVARADAMKRNTATDVANNAIDLKLLLTENQGPDSLAAPLRTFGQAELRARQYRFEEALQLLGEVRQTAGDHPILPIVDFRRAAALRELDRADEAIVLLQQIPERFPDSYLTDRAAFLAAEIIERDHQDRAAALDAYLSFLSNHPGSLLAAEARTRIRRLRGDLPGA